MYVQTEAHDFGEFTQLLTSPAQDAKSNAPASSCVAMFVYADQTIDWPAIEAFEQERISLGEKHYEDVGDSLMEAWNRAKVLGVFDAERQLRVLDIGTGAGCLPFVCRYLGHEAIGMDLPHTRDHHAVLRQSLGIDIIKHRIAAGRPLPMPPAKFDLITAFRVQFDRRKDGVPWSAEDWSFFLDNLRDNYLADNGRLAMRVRLQDSARRDLFANRGGVLPHEKQKLVIFDPLT